ncbi:VOC family protein [Williamsia sp. CHRR-6]|uniref:VOC family protein n=1 Tax=Williamsia sp. CHRR-6 TaxID=2835871 RepID=UPI001BDA8BD4|nr:VOC family protein [Williamsia sp. CHRR-6]MBT0566639.1 VOC family protein [Williamsia sp. CHRR-6]
MNAITPCLWFAGDLGDALEFYPTVFADFVVHSVNSGPAGEVYTAEFELNGQRLIALNHPSDFRFNESMSLMISCADQAEVDHYWDGLIQGGKPSQCGWLVDRFGLSWQVVPTRLHDLLNDPDPARAQAAMNSMLSMTRLDIATLEAAAASAG